MTKVNIGTAGWGIPRQNAGAFPEKGTSLQRYATRFAVAEINSSFHRRHRASTWERWRDSVPDDFRFSAKIPKTITHQAKLVDCTGLVEEFLQQAGALGEKLAVLLVQLPPKLEFDAEIAVRFFSMLGASSHAKIACEPRHPSWFTDEAQAVLEENHIARVAADPAICDGAARPGGWGGFSYWRLHGSPVIYRSSYGNRIADYAALLRADDRESWCIFDNTASSAGAGDALALMEALRQA